MARQWAVIAGIGLAALPTGSGSAQPLIEHDIGVHLALDMVHAAIAECEAKNLSVSVVVLDRAGRVRAMAMADRELGGHTVELARRKAYTALTFQRPSRDWVESLGADGAKAGELKLTEVIPLPGGQAVKLGEETIGAVGVAGSTIETDEACAKTAAAVGDGHK
jgi:uncharacterized protein GlcG (DUF336 family)